MRPKQIIYCFNVDYSRFHVNGYYNKCGTLLADARNKSFSGKRKVAEKTRMIEEMMNGAKKNNNTIDS